MSPAGPGRSRPPPRSSPVLAPPVAGDCSTQPKLTTSKSESLAEGQGLDYKDYFQFTEPIRQIPPHRILAINRGEKENVLGVKLEFDPVIVERVALDNLPLADHPHAELLKAICSDA